MQDIETRAKQAESLWAQGDAAVSSGDLANAYKLYTQAHDLVTDCAKLHEKAHHKLRPVTRTHADKREYITDTLLIALAPLGVFRLLEIYFRSKVGGSELCRGRAAM